MAVIARMLKRCDCDAATRVQVMYPKLRMEEEGATVVVCGVHPAPMKYTGKHG
jgi:hypothetical protein